MGKVVFHVFRATKTGKSVNVGDFDTLDQAKVAMLEHYKKTPKRGQFYYHISEDELEEVDGVVFRKVSFSNDGSIYHKTFMPDELKSMLEE